MTAAARPLAVLLTAALVAGPLPSAAAPPEERSPAFRETVDVEVVNVDVYVTDRAGNPVGGLTRDEFELFEDGDRVAIDYFQAVGFAADGSPAPPGAGGLAPPTGTAAGPGPTVLLDGLPGGGQPAHVVVFVDNANIAPGNRNRVLGRLGEFVERAMAGGSRVMVVTNDGSPQVRLGFSDDPEEVAAALAGLEGLSERGFSRLAERRALLTSIEQLDRSVFQILADEKAQANRATSSGSERPQMLESELLAIVSQVRMYAETQYHQVTGTVGTLTGFAELLGRLPGRKAIVHVSDGVPMRPGQEMIWALQESFQDGRRLARMRFESLGTQQSAFSNSTVFEVRSLGSEIATYDATPAYAEMVEVASASRVALYTINGAATAGPLMDAELSGGEAAVFSGGAGAFQTVAQSSDQEGVRYMADGTGGLSLSSGAGVEAFLDRVLGDLTSYYSLGFVPRGAADGAFHELKVKLARKGLTVRHRQGYRREATVDLGERAASALILGFEDNPLGLDLQLMKQVRQDDQKNFVHFLLRVPIDSLTLVPGAEHHAAEGMVYVVTRDASGQLSTVQEFPFHFEIPNDQLAAATAGHWGLPMVLGLEPGPYHLAVALRDESSGAGSVVRTAVEVRGWEWDPESLIP